MVYKVFLVEDEIVAREGIRNAINWRSVGFEFCGEASDGEMALPQIETYKPDVLITDIRMPFMDGLQLSRIVREHMPWVKIIILSGYDEFEYAQTALKIGVTQYLLKPVSAADIIEALKTLSISLDQEKSERERLKRLSSQATSNLQLRREQLLLRLVMGGISSGDAVELGQHLGLNLVAQHYLVMLVRIELCDDSLPYDYETFQRSEDAVQALITDSPDVLLTKKGPEELILIFKGDGAAQLQQAAAMLAGLIQKENVADPICRLRIEMGSPQDRLSDLHRSFSEALVRAKTPTGSPVTADSPEREGQIGLPRLDHQELENYLRFGNLADLDMFFEDNLRVMCESALYSDPVKHYLFLEVFLAVAQFVSDLETECPRTPEIHEIEHTLQLVTTLGQIEEKLKRAMSDALALRDEQANYQRTMLIHQAKAYIDDHFNDPDLQMSFVAQMVSLSPNHFSTVFSQEIGEPFRDYVSNLRINHAKALLRTTNMICAEVAHESGYNDAHYFSTLFKKKTGLTPQQFRRRAQSNKA